MAAAAGLMLGLAGCGTEGAPQDAAGNAGAGGSAQGGSAAGSPAGGGGAGGGVAGGASGSGGAGGTGVGGSGGSGGSGSSGAGGGGASGGGFVPPAPIDCQEWPTPGETVELGATMEVSGVMDGQMKRYVGVGDLSGDGQTEDMPPMMRLAPGTVLKNVVIGAPASDGIHCDGTCYLQNVWWEDVGEDAATLDGTDPTQSMTIECAGARHAADKIFQHNGPGTYVLTNVFVEDFNKMYRSCGNCIPQYERHARLSNIEAQDGEVLAGVNENYGDSVTFDDITADDGIDICWLYEGNDTGAEPSMVDSGADPVHCLYETSDITRP